ncbi:leucine carboxyl methyltransferase 2 [Truncatella angustata]|uniref:tRNA wybutosine-synthesizing protein 4 n=1 Tax=Truncatella angustata TaxID=152316 RepID=A0A9P8UQ04_9PEZI|nr:leucine carboxyl methyltransferase 2 [Truncatella angustata]KAH6656201.1 leucine carboxyl methyltransferase 2 [Truncatella angustata]
MYYPDEPYFYRFFVKKFQKRSPLINRGYHLQLHVINVAVRNFLQSPSEKRKVVVNLGAGYDVLPWQCLTRYPAACKDAKFIDIDFPDLMSNKSRVVQETSGLNSMLTNLRVPEDPLVLLESDQYIQIGCDLRDLNTIQQSLSRTVDMAESEFMFVAEVSITYMETVAADAVIKWASSLGQAEFCLLEQILPDSADHPFAETMLRHFEKLNTPLKSVAAYPTLHAQKQRFTGLGWSCVHVETLWSTWSSEKYLSSEDRCKINEVEPFDDWEEFAIFGSHYCVVSATTGPAHKQSSLVQQTDFSTPTKQELPHVAIETVFKEGLRTCQRRFGAPLLLEDSRGYQYIANIYGLGSTSRLKSLDLYASGTTDIPLKPAGPPSRICHQVVDLGVSGHLLVGGRGSLSAPLKDCWVMDKVLKSWKKTHDLPMPLYRHAAVRLGESSLALVVGGKVGPSTMSDKCLLYVPERGWVECEATGQTFVPVFGSMVASTNRSLCGPSAVFEGILAGGLLGDGTLSKQILRWELSVANLDKPVIAFTSLVVEGPQDRLRSHHLLERFGANVIMTKSNQLLVIGGIIENQILAGSVEILFVDVSNKTLTVTSAGQIDARGAPRPLLLGISTTKDACGQVVLSGGGANCFSAGTFWNKGHYVLKLDESRNQDTMCRMDWSFRRTMELTDMPVFIQKNTSGEHAERPTVTTIPRVKLNSSSAFAEIMKAGKPVVIERTDLGSCVSLWTPDHLVSKVGKERKVVVHEAGSAKMDFNSKNFKYVTKEFGTFLSEAEQGGKMYLRALSEDNPADKPASLSRDFPDLADEFRLPAELSFVAEHSFSSVLRISGPVNMWLHYDVMANIYCQIIGSKRLVLFPPGDVTELSFSPGASSSSLDVFAELDSAALAQTHPCEAILTPGDVLFLPPLWLHTANPKTDLGVAVNVFFRSLEDGYAAGRDVYGNRDLAVYEKGRHDVARIVNTFSKLPEDMREFYVKRLAGELVQRLYE